MAKEEAAQRHVRTFCRPVLSGTHPFRTSRSSRACTKGVCSAAMLLCAWQRWLLKAHMRSLCRSEVSGSGAAHPDTCPGVRITG